MKQAPEERILWAADGSVNYYSSVGSLICASLLSPPTAEARLRRRCLIVDCFCGIFLFLIHSTTNTLCYCANVILVSATDLFPSMEFSLLFLALFVIVRCCLTKTEVSSTLTYEDYWSTNDDDISIGSSRDIIVVYCGLFTQSLQSRSQVLRKRCRRCV